MLLKIVTKPPKFTTNLQILCFKFITGGSEFMFLKLIVAMELLFMFKFFFYSPIPSILQNYSTGGK